MKGQRWFGPPGKNATAKALVQGALTAVAANSTSITGDLPTAPSAGNLLVAMLQGLDGTAWTAPAGWTMQGQVSIAQPGTAPATNTARYAIMTRFAVAGDGTSWSFALPGDGDSNYSIFLGLEEWAGVSAVGAFVSGTATASPVSSGALSVSLGDAVVGGSACFSAQGDTGNSSVDASSQPTSGWISSVQNSALYGGGIVTRVQGMEQLEAVLIVDYVEVNSSNPCGCCGLLQLK